MSLTADELALVIRLYLFVGLIVTALIVMKITGRLSSWIWDTSVGAFLATAIGWEIWFTYGLIGGDSVNQRRSDALNTAVPAHINWALNSVADVGMCLIGLYLVRLAYGSGSKVFKQWHWGAFSILFSWLILQNLYVEMVVYAEQVTSGVLAWAPMAPTGPWFNPILFEIAGHPATLQGQIPWVIMTPLLYWMVIRANNQ